MKREELEELHWTERHVQIWRPEGIGHATDVLKLAAAAPALALACMKAVAVLEILRSEFNLTAKTEEDGALVASLRELLDQTPTQLRAALAAAGVEVEP